MFTTDADSTTMQVYIIELSAIKADQMRYHYHGSIFPVTPSAMCEVTCAMENKVFIIWVNES